MQRMDEVDAFCMNTAECRRVMLLSYFGEVFDRNSCVRGSGCDNCSHMDVAPSDVTSIARAVVDLLEQIASSDKPKLGKVQISNILRGGNAKAVLDWKSYPAFQSLPTTDKSSVQTVIIHLARSDILVEETQTQRWGVTITYGVRAHFGLACVVVVISYCVVFGVVGSEVPHCSLFWLENGAANQEA